MKKQEKTIVIRINEELKDKFNKKAESNAMSLSARIKYLMKLDIDNKLKILTNGN
jgi:predicted HicB family RNase H-like nuclease